jgi:hypothetical protein
MRNSTDVTCGKPIAVLWKSISGVSAINPLVTFFDIRGGKREVLFFYFVPDTTRDRCYSIVLSRTSQGTQNIIIMFIDSLKTIISLLSDYNLNLIQFYLDEW